MIFILLIMIGILFITTYYVFLILRNKRKFKKLEQIQRLKNAQDKYNRAFGTEQIDKLSEFEI